MVEKLYGIGHFSAIVWSSIVLFSGCSSGFLHGLHRNADPWPCYVIL